MFQYYCLNPIAQVGLDGFGADYKKTEDIKEADGVLVRSAAMHDMELPEKLLAVARAGAGVNNIPLDNCLLYTSRQNSTAVCQLSGRYGRITGVHEAYIK